MNRGDVKLMIDRLNSVTLSVDAEDEQTIDAAVYMLGELSNENAKLQANLDRHMEVIVTGRKANEMLYAKYSTLFNAVKNLRDVKGRHHSQIAYERLMTVIGEEK